MLRGLRLSRRTSAPSRWRLLRAGRERATRCKNHRRGRGAPWRCGGGRRWRRGFVSNLGLHALQPSLGGEFYEFVEHLSQVGAFAMCNLRVERAEKRCSFGYFFIIPFISLVPGGIHSLGWRLIEIYFFGPGQPFKQVLPYSLVKDFRLAEEPSLEFMNGEVHAEFGMVYFWLEFVDTPLISLNNAANICRKEIVALRPSEV